MGHSLCLLSQMPIKRRFIPATTDGLGKIFFHLYLTLSIFEHKGNLRALRILPVVSAAEPCERSGERRRTICVKIVHAVNQNAQNLTALGIS
jgi:hypothetical protein